MPRMPADMYLVAVKQPRWHDKRRHVIGLINWRLANGMVFHPKDILAACRQTVSIKFVNATIDMVVEEGLAVPLKGNRYGPSRNHIHGRRAMYLNLMNDGKTVSPKDVYLSLPVPENRNDVRIMLSELEADGVIEKIGRGCYCKVEQNIKIAV